MSLERSVRTRACSRPTAKTCKTASTVAFPPPRTPPKTGIGLELAPNLGLNLPLARATKEQYDRMIVEGRGELDKPGIAELTFSFADQGINFRIDSCQYVYNLNSSALGAGTYRVDILINGQVVGSGVFQLK